MDNRFTDIIKLIKQSRTNAIKAVNAELINLYWNIGEHISKKIEQSEWGDSVLRTEPLPHHNPAPPLHWPRHVRDRRLKFC